MVKMFRWLLGVLLLRLFGAASTATEIAALEVVAEQHGEALALADRLEKEGKKELAAKLRAAIEKLPLTPSLDGAPPILLELGADPPAPPEERRPLLPASTSPAGNAPKKRGRPRKVALPEPGTNHFQDSKTL